MRTTIDLPDDLGRQVKVRAAQDGESIKSLIARALERELAAGRGGGAPRKPVRLPVLRSHAPGALKLTPDEVGAWLVREEAAVYGADVRR